MFHMTFSLPSQATPSRDDGGARVVLGLSRRGARDYRMAVAHVWSRAVPAASCVAPAADLSETLVEQRMRQGEKRGRCRPEWEKALQQQKDMAERQTPLASKGAVA